MFAPGHLRYWGSVRKGTNTVWSQQRRVDLRQRHSSWTTYHIRHNVTALSNAANNEGGFFTAAGSHPTRFAESVPAAALFMTVQAAGAVSHLDES